jgi:hypothetical protein
MIGTHTDYYMDMYKQGTDFQNYVLEVLRIEFGWEIRAHHTDEEQVQIGENSAGFEIKLDKKFRQTGNFWIECQERSNKHIPYSPAGIFAKDNAWLFIMGDYETIYIFSKKQLRVECEKRKHIINNMDTSVGFLLPIKEAEHLILHKIDLNIKKTDIIGG